MEKILKVVREGHVGELIFGHIMLGKDKFLCVETVNGALSPGRYPMTFNENGVLEAEGDYRLMTDVPNRHSARGIRPGIHLSPKGWDVTDKATIRAFLLSECKGAEVVLDISYHEYPKAVGSEEGGFEGEGVIDDGPYLD